MAGLFDKQAEIYASARPTYPPEWFRWLAGLTSGHSLAWDAGTGNGQAAVAVAEHYKQVIATDVSSTQLKYAMPHPRVQYIHTPISNSNDELVALFGSENSVDLVTVAVAVHWFDLPSFYNLVTRLLRKPGGVIAVWGYHDFEVSPTFDHVFKSFHETTLPFYNPNIHYILEEYKTLPFPFESVGLGSEGKPVALDIAKELSFEGLLGMLRSRSAITTARERGVDLLSERVVKELEIAWGGASLVRLVTYKAFMLAGKVAM